MNTNARALLPADPGPDGPWSLAPRAASPSPAAPITVLYGSHTGNCENLARRIGRRLAERGVTHALLDMIECRKSHLQQATTALLIVSTHGDGDPPERAVPLVELLNGRKAPRLDHLRYSVLALGDSSYPKFCEAGRRLDQRLEALGAERIQARVDCDVDFDTSAQRWIDGLIERLAADSPAAGSPATGAAAPAASADRRPALVASAYTRKNPFLAPVLTNQRLTGLGSTKDVRHVELSIDGANLHYEPGDALGIVVHNRAQDVDALIAALRLDPRIPVEMEPGAPISLRRALAERYEIGRIETASGAHALGAREFLQELRPLAPRLYSIASSPRATPDEVHLTVAIAEYVADGCNRRGLVSGHIAEATLDGAQLPVYLHRNPGFRLPADPATPIVMIGPGTGVAPFRAFLMERAALGSSGRNWLFFGDRSFETDFLYQAEWIDWRKRGVLNRIDVAFSRDRTEKTYVQHRLAQRGAELWRWIEDGAHIYVCGDAEHMAPDVHRALLAIVARHGGSSAEGARETLLEMQRTRRYQRDVY